MDLAPALRNEASHFEKLQLRSRANLAVDSKTIRALEGLDGVSGVRTPDSILGSSIIAYSVQKELHILNSGSLIALYKRAIREKACNHKVGSIVNLIDGDSSDHVTAVSGTNAAKGPVDVRLVEEQLDASVVIGREIVSDAAAFANAIVQARVATITASRVAAKAQEAVLIAKMRAKSKARHFFIMNFLSTVRLCWLAESV